MLDELKSFGDEIEKRAVSVGKTLAVLRNRVGQGAAVAPALLADVEKGVGAASTPANMRRLALNAGDDARRQQAMQRSISNPVTEQSRQRLVQGYESAVRRDPGVFSSKALPSHYDYGAAGMTPKPVAYAKVHADSLAGQSQLVDPRGLLQQRQPAARRLSQPATAVTAIDPSSRARAGLLRQGGAP